MILSIAQCVWNITKAFWYLPSFHPTTKGFWVEFWVGMKLRHTCITCFAKSKTRPQGDASHTPWSRCASVWNFYKLPISKIFFYSFDHGSLPFCRNVFYLKVWAILFLSFFLFLFFSSCSLACIFFSHAFCHAYIFSFILFF